MDHDAASHICCNLDQLASLREEKTQLLLLLLNVYASLRAGASRDETIAKIEDLLPSHITNEQVPDETNA